jgi:hypothetical protein
MATRRDFSISAVQMAIFTVEHSSVFSTGRAVAIILQKYGSRFDGEMQALPLPSEIPAEIPHVILQSSDGNWRFQMGPARIDAIWTNRTVPATVNLDEVVLQCGEMLEHYLREARVKVGRAALVVNRICPVANPASTLIERFCNEASKPEPFNRSANFEIHNHKVFLPQRAGIDYKINSWVRCKTGELEAGNRPIILVVQDLNTVANEAEARRFTPEQLKGFFQMARQEADEIFAKYFPE